MGDDQQNVMIACAAKERRAQSGTGFQIERLPGAFDDCGIESRLIPGGRVDLFEVDLVRFDGALLRSSTFFAKLHAQRRMAIGKHLEGGAKCVAVERPADA
jgi:hypothetical protein